MMLPHPSRKLRSFATVLAITVTAAACVSTPETGGGNLAAVTAGEVRKIEDLVLVDCLLPGQIRQLGTQMTYLSPRRRVKTTKSDCGIRGGEFILFDRADYGTALRTLLPQARAGDVVAQTYVGEIYERGLGLPAPDYATAAVWYRKAADKGHSPAQTNLGSLYERGLGVPERKDTALNLYRQAIGVDDPVIFESRLKAERARFQREIALRNNVAANLRKQLKLAQGKQHTKTRVVYQPAPAPVGSNTGDKKPPEKVVETAQGKPVANVRDLLRAANNLSRGTESAIQQAEKEAHALETVAKAEAAAKNQARVGKMKLSLRQKEQEVQALQASVVEQRRLAGR